MTRAGLIDALAAKFPLLDAKDVDVSVKAIMDAMTGGLANGDHIEIRDFSSFNLNQRKPRTARNPKTGEKTQVPAKLVLHFKPGKEMRERVDKIGNHGMR